ncbi:MAG TPA: MFS transporter [Bacteroidia bacterium]|nr:MFS transporter [Bacteroidia bacterium]
MSINKNNPKVIHGWVMYDWANSVYSLSIATAIFPIFFVKVLPPEVNIFGLTTTSSALYSYCVSLAFLLVALVSPLLSGIADYKGNKKTFMKFFVYLGSLSCLALWFFRGEDTLFFGVVPFILATFAFAGSLMFYNAYLHEIVTPDRMDSVSARGFSMGYIGSVILLVVNLVIMMKGEWFGIAPDDSFTGPGIAFITVGLWWAGFSQVSFAGLPPSENKNPYGKQLLLHGYQELRKVWGQLKSMHSLKTFLLSFFLYSMGLQTVMYVASVFGEVVIKLETIHLIITILIIQLVGVLGAILFSRLSARFGNVASITVALILWMVICGGAYILPEKNFPGFAALGGLVGLVMGGSQAISRSTYAKLLPVETEDHASFFSFYDVTEKLSIVIGTFVWGLIDNLLDMRSGIFALAVFFVLGIIVLRRVRDVRLSGLSRI